MRNSFKSFVLATMMALTGAALAADTATPPAPGTDAPGTDAPAKKPHKKELSGKVESTTATTIVIKNKKDGEVTVTVDANTKYTLDREPADLSKITAGLYVSITPSTGTAAMVHASTHAPEHKPKPEAPAAPANK